MIVLEYSKEATLRGIGQEFVRSDGTSILLSAKATILNETLMSLCFLNNILYRLRVKST